MAYTVKKLREMSGVTIRTLHFYEEIGLLKPAYYGSNGYRYYEEKELLQLQQILFFKELGFSLKQIQKVLGRDDFNQLSALYSHKNALIQEYEKLGQLLKTVDKTINHLIGKKKMTDKEIFDGFSLSVVKIANKDASYFDAEAIVLKSVINPTIEKREQSFNENIVKKAHTIFKELVTCIDQGLEPDANKVQRIIKKHHTFIKKFHYVTKEVYKALAQLYMEHPSFKTQLTPFNSKLPPFMGKAMIFFAEKKLS